jgi:tRNA pseudouridine38-40 synthase
VRGVNAQLPDAIAIRWAREVDDEFHARFSAQRRRYHYLLLNRAERPALFAGRVGWCHRPLDAAPMREAAALLAGQHDFSSFRSSECQAKSPVKTLAPIDIAADGALFTFTFTADAFLHHMVRNIVGALVMVGKGAHPPAWLGELLALRDRTHGPATFMPDGLYLTGIQYDPRFGLPGLETGNWKPETRMSGLEFPVSSL